MASLELKAIAALVVAAALALGLFLFGRHERAIVEAKFAQQAAAETAANAIETARRAADQRENHREADRFNTVAAADGRALDAVVQRLREQSSGRGRPAADPGTRPASAADAVPASELVPADDVCGRAIQAAADAAKSLDCWRSHGAACEADYQSLTPSAAPP